MKKILPIELNVLIGILIIVGIVGANGIFAYKNMSEVLNSINDAEKPDAKLILLKEISSDLSDAEGNVKAFAVSKDSVYYYPIFESEKSINRKLDLLIQFKDMKKSTEENKSDTDTILALIKNKFYILNELLIFKDDDNSYKQRNFDLTQRDKEVNSKLRVLITKMEGAERKLIDEKTKEADKMSQKAKTLIAIFCVTASLLILIVAFGIIRYIRTNKAYNKALKSAKNHAEFLVKAKENFVANMSHEIRTPLNAIIGFTEQAINTPSKSEQRKQLEVVKKSADHLMNIINDILDFSKLEAGKVTFEKINFELEEIVSDVTQIMSALLEDKKDVKMTCSIDKNTPGTLLGDPMRLKQILLNITGNAVKFTQKGSIDIKVSSSQYKSHEVLLNIVVSDTGVGIKKDQLARIFSAFEQEDTSITRKYGGTGLGLSITKKLVELQNGNVNIVSTLHKGTSVTVMIPYRIGKTEVAVKGESINHNGTLNIKSVLIADDEQYNRLLLATIFKKWGIDYSEVKNGQEVLDQLKENDYDLILMDALMPTMGGVEATEQIRNMKGKKAKIPIIALSAATSKEDIQRYINGGMNDFLSKPFKEKDLHDKIESVMGSVSIKNGVKNDKKKPIVKKIENEKVNKYNLDELYRVADGNDTFVDEMIKVFIKTTGEGVKLLKEYTEQKDWNKVANQAHKIAAPCLHIGADELYSMIKKVEENGRAAKNTEDIPGIVKKIEHESANLISLLEKESDKNHYNVSL